MATIKVKVSKDVKKEIKRISAEFARTIEGKHFTENDLVNEGIQMYFYTWYSLYNPFGKDDSLIR